VPYRLGLDYNYLLKACFPDTSKTDYQMDKIIGLLLSFPDASNTDYQIEKINDLLLSFPNGSNTDYQMDKKSFF
jgi:hypothetical protein